MYRLRKRCLGGIECLHGRGHLGFCVHEVGVVVGGFVAVEDRDINPLSKTLGGTPAPRRRSANTESGKSIAKQHVDYNRSDINQQLGEVHRMTEARGSEFIVECIQCRWTIRPLSMH
jgi:hypothetical protein